MGSGCGEVAYRVHEPRPRQPDLVRHVATDDIERLPDHMAELVGVGILPFWRHPVVDQNWQVPLVVSAVVQSGVGRGTSHEGVAPAPLDRGDQLQYHRFRRAPLAH